MLDKLKSCINTLTDSVSRGLGALISKLKTLKSTRYKTYTSLFNSQVVTILDYCSSVWGFKKASQFAYLFLYSWYKLHDTNKPTQKRTNSLHNATYMYKKKRQIKESTCRVSVATH